MKNMENINNSGKSTIYHPDMNMSNYANEYSGGYDIGVRKALVNAGLDNDRIGWDGQNVTYDGKAILTPERNDNGTTYASARNIFSGYSRATNQPLVDVTHQAAMSGISNAVEYGEGGTVFVGGVPVNNTLIIGGQAYAPASAVSQALDYAKSAKGYMSAADVYNNYLNSTAEARKNLMDKYENFKDFSYDPESDVSYQAYKNQYERQAKKVYENVIGGMAAATGGYANSAGIAAGAEAYYDHMSALNDRVPELARDAYDRYKFDYQRLMDALELYGTPRQMYEYGRDAYTQHRQDVNEAFKADYQRSLDTRKYNMQNALNNAKIREIDNGINYKNALLPYEQDIQAEAARGQRAENDYYIRTAAARALGIDLENELTRSQINLNNRR